MKVDLVVAEFAEFNTPILCSLLLRVGSAFGVDPGPSSEYLSAIRGKWFFLLKFPSPEKLSMLSTRF